MFKAFTFSLLAASTVWADGLKSTVTKSTIQFGERTRIEFHLPISALGLAKYDDESELPVLNDDLITDSKSLMVLERDFAREKDVLVWRFDITSYHKGKVIVPPVEIRFGPHTFSSEAIPLEIQSGRAPGDKALRPDYGEVPFPINLFLWAKLLVALGIVGVLFYYHRKYPHWRARLATLRTRVIRPRVTEEAPESWLRRELDRLKARLQETEPGRPPIVDDFTRTLRGFFMRKTAKPAESWTTAELKRNLPGVLPTEVEPLLAQADAWKFGQEKTDPKGAIVEPGITTSERALL